MSVDNCDGPTVSASERDSARDTAEASSHDPHASSHSPASEIRRPVNGPRQESVDTEPRSVVTPQSPDMSPGRTVNSYHSNTATADGRGTQIWVNPGSEGSRYFTRFAPTGG